MEVLVWRFEMHIPLAQSLKEKRAVLRPITEGMRAKFNVSVSEVDHADQWQRAAIGVAVVSGSAAHATEQLDAIERWVWSHDGFEVFDSERFWAEAEPGRQIGSER